MSPTLPPNHKLVPITLSYTVSDAVDPHPQVTCSATSNQAANGTGDGNTNPDIVWSGDALSLRAERSGNAGDRIYTISCTAKNIGGKTTTKSATARDFLSGRRRSASMPAPMRVAVWLIVLYLLIDFSDPGLPGAFSFNADESVEAVHAQKVKMPIDPVRAPTPAPGIDDGRLTNVLRAPRVEIAVVATTLAAPRSPTILLRPHITHLSSEDCPAASPVV
ncbi:MAG: hypothetical protein ACT4P5_17445 [Armatimonadota bacterium]